MQNKLLKSKNPILLELNEVYYVTKPLNPDKDNSGEYLVYERPNGNGLSFFATVKTKPKKKTLFFNNKEYDNKEELLSDIAQYNSTLPYPIHTYDPFSRKSYITDIRISWYLKDVLGFQKEKDDWNISKFSLKNNEGKELTSISYELPWDLDDDTTHGTIYKRFDGGLLTSAEFDNEDEAVNIINSFVIYDIGISFSKVIEVMNNFKGGFSNLKNANTYKTNNIIDAEKVDTLKLLKEKLQSALDALDDVSQEVTLRPEETGVDAVFHITKDEPVLVSQKKNSPKTTPDKAEWLIGVKHRDMDVYMSTNMKYIEKLQHGLLTKEEYLKLAKPIQIWD